MAREEMQLVGQNAAGTLRLYRDSAHPGLMGGPSYLIQVDLADETIEIPAPGYFHLAVLMPGATALTELQPPAGGE